MNNENLSISYNKSWRLLIDRGMKKKELQEAGGISVVSIDSLGRNSNVMTDILLKICGALHCDISDILEIKR